MSNTNPSQPENSASEGPIAFVGTARPTRRRRLVRGLLYVLKTGLQPLIAIGAIIALAFGFGYAQKNGFFISADSEAGAEANEETDTEYVCPMLCVPPTKVPGRCPVCGMELEPRTVSGDPKDIYGLTIDPASRRLSNIKTVVATRVPLTKQINALGRIGYDETSEATISAYVDGRLEKLFVDFTGADVRKGEPLALLYSSDLYSSQVELLESKKAMETSESTRERVIESNKRMYESARRRLNEFGIPESRITEIEESGQANSRIKIVSPITGTVTEKFVVEGKYVSTGEALFQVVDLSTVWLIIELFPEDARYVRYGQNVIVSVQSRPGDVVKGRVAFIDPIVDATTRTVQVRVVIPNEAGLIRIGDYATATVQVDINPNGELLEAIYDPELAGKWISPNHPYIVRDQPGKCPECGVDLVPASQYGFVTYQSRQQGSVVVPRQAVLIAGKESVAYVETEPGRFEFRQVTVGPTSGELVSIVSGIQAGEIVVYNAAFMVDAAFNMSGKPSLIDPTRAQKKDETRQEFTPDQLTEITKAMSDLSTEDRVLAENQVICPVTEFALGSMGTPIKVSVSNRDVFICCEGCRDRLINDPDRYFAVLDSQSENTLSSDELMEIEKAFEGLSPEDRLLSEQQVICPVTEFHLGSMGPPIRIHIDGRDVMICCEGCRDRLTNDSKKYFTILDSQKGGARIGGSAADHSASEDEEVDRALESLSASDRALVIAQGYCPVADFRLGGMGTPLKVQLNGQPVFICCEGCREELLGKPDEYLARIEEYKKNGGKKLTELEAGQSKSIDHNLPQMTLPKMKLPQRDLPKMELPK